MKKTAAFSFSMMMAFCLIMNHGGQSFAQSDTSNTVKKTVGIDSSKKYRILKTDLTNDKVVGAKVTAQTKKKKGEVDVKSTLFAGSKSDLNFSQDNGAAGVITGSTTALAGAGGSADLNFKGSGSEVGVDFSAKGFAGLQAAVKAGFSQNTGDLSSSLDSKVTGQLGVGGETGQGFYVGKDGVSGLFSIGAGAGPKLNAEVGANTKFQGYDLDTAKAEGGFGGVGAGVTVGASLRKDKIGAELGGFLGLRGTFGYYYSPEGYSKVLEKYVPGYKDLPDSVKLAGGAAAGLLPAVLPNGKLYTKTALSYLESQQSGTGMANAQLEFDPNNVNLQYVTSQKSSSGGDVQFGSAGKKSAGVPKKSNPEEIAAKMAASKAEPGTEKYNAIYNDYLKALTFNTGKATVAKTSKQQNFFTPTGDTDKFLENNGITKEEYEEELAKAKRSEGTTGFDPTYLSKTRDTTYDYVSDTKSLQESNYKQMLSDLGLSDNAELKAKYAAFCDPTNKAFQYDLGKFLDAWAKDVDPKVYGNDLANVEVRHVAMKAYARMGGYENTLKMMEADGKSLNHYNFNGRTGVGQQDVLDIAYKGYVGRVMEKTSKGDASAIVSEKGQDYLGQLERGSLDKEKMAQIVSAVKSGKGVDGDTLKSNFGWIDVDPYICDAIANLIKADPNKYLSAYKSK